MSGGTLLLSVAEMTNDAQRAALLMEKLLDEQEESARLRARVAQLAAQLSASAQRSASTGSAATASEPVLRQRTPSVDRTVHQRFRVLHAGAGATGISSEGGGVVSGRRGSASRSPPAAAQDGRPSSSSRAGSARTSPTGSTVATRLAPPARALQQLISQQRELFATLTAVGRDVVRCSVAAHAVGTRAPAVVSAASEAMLVALRGAVLNFRHWSASDVFPELAIAASDPALQLRAHWAQALVLMAPILAQHAAAASATASPPPSATAVEATAPQRVCAGGDGGDGDGDGDDARSGESAAAARRRDFLRCVRVVVISHDHLAPAHRAQQAAWFLDELAAHFEALCTALAALGVLGERATARRGVDAAAAAAASLVAPGEAKAARRNGDPVGVFHGRLVPPTRVAFAPTAAATKSTANDAAASSAPPAHRPSRKAPVLLVIPAVKIEPPPSSSGASGAARDIGGPAIPIPGPGESDTSDTDAAAAAAPRTSQTPSPENAGAAPVPTALVAGRDVRPRTRPGSKSPTAQQPLHFVGVAGRPADEFDDEFGDDVPAGPSLSPRQRSKSADGRSASTATTTAAPLARQAVVARPRSRPASEPPRRRDPPTNVTTKA